MTRCPATTLPRVHVVAGALFDAHGRVLLAQRPEGKHMAGGWEFPGGKLEPNEARYDGLVRELLEELGVEVQAAEPLISYEHEYPTKCIVLDLWLVTRYAHEPRPLEGQPLQWVELDDLDTIGLLKADAPMVPALRAARRLSDFSQSSQSEDTEITEQVLPKTD